MADDTTIVGLDKLIAKLKALPPHFEKAAQKALAEGAEEIVATMRNFCPVDQGDLRASIGWTFGDAPKGSIRIAGGSVRIGRNRKINLTIFAGNAAAYYVRFVEFGTAPHAQGGKFKGTESPGTVAHPFFFPAWRLKKKKVKSYVSREMNKAAKALAI
jgi:HK97 gp10 family phage protein